LVVVIQGLVVGIGMMGKATFRTTMGPRGRVVAVVKQQVVEWYLSGQKISKLMKLLVQQERGQAHLLAGGNTELTLKTKMGH